LPRRLTQLRHHLRVKRHIRPCSPSGIGHCVVAKLAEFIDNGLRNHNSFGFDLLHEIGFFLFPPHHATFVELRFLFRRREQCGTSIWDSPIISFHRVYPLFCRRSNQLLMNLAAPLAVLRFEGFAMHHTRISLSVPGPSTSGYAASSSASNSLLTPNS